MYVVIFFGQGINGLTLIVYGPYATLAAANAAVGANSTNGQYYVVQPTTLPTGNPNVPPTPSPVVSGQFVLVQSVVNLLGNTQYNVFGPYSTLQAAQLAGLSLPYTGGQLAAVVTAPI